MHVAAGSPEIESTAQAAVMQHIVRDLPQQLIGATIEAIAEMTIKLAQQEPEKAEGYTSSGFELLWAGLARKL